MFNSTIFSTITRNSFYVLVLLLVSFVFEAKTIIAQTELGKTVYGNQKNSSNSGKTKTPPKTKTTSRKSTQPVTKTRPKTNYVAAKTPPQPIKKVIRKSLITVTFIGKEPLVEVWLNDKNIGFTDGKLQLSKRLAAGEYRLMAKSNRQVLLSTKKITVTPEQTFFNLFAENEPNADAGNANQKMAQQTPKEKSELELAIEISETVKKILEKYADPKTTDLVTTDDWQIVFQAAQLGQLQGYTAVQIEAQRWFASGQIEFAKKEYVNAFTAFNKAVEFMPNSALPFYGLGNTYLAKNQLTDALRCYLKALQLDTKLAMGYKKLGDTLRLQGKEKEAVSAYKNALKFGYQTSETRYWLGTLLIQTKQIEAGIQELEKIAKESPKAEFFISIGDGYEKLKRDVSAIENYQKAIELDPNSGIAYYKLANIYLEQREYTRAKEAFEKAISLDPDGKGFNRIEAQKKLREATTKINK